MDTAAITDTVDRSVARWAPRALAVLAGLLWLTNVIWKVPTDFGALAGFTQAGVDHPVVPGSAWFFEHVALANIEAFGWLTLFVESALAVALLAGRWVRTAAVVGAGASAAIGLAVANADDEWYWAYVLMIGLHLAVLAVAPRVAPVPPRAMAVAVAAYGAVVAVAHAGAGLTGDGNADWTLFSGTRDLPDELGRNTFTGSIALGLVFVALAVGAWVLAGAPERVRTAAGWVAVGAAAALALTYRPDGVVVELGSTVVNLCVLAALGLTLTVPDRVPGSAAPSGERAGVAAR